MVGAEVVALGSPCGLGATSSKGLFGSSNVLIVCRLLHSVGVDGRFLTRSCCTPLEFAPPPPNGGPLGLDNQPLSPRGLR